MGSELCTLKIADKNRCMLNALGDIAAGDAQITDISLYSVYATLVSNVIK